ncbi:outer membrane protein assembly factor BamD [Microvirgula aerodenitrificans]|uniref:outer membrane protein assembly factor BamD n=1 Tax=Microvirgula aerodenitrificans TaxID=57480 RepID=UPI00248DCFCA|nr:outer membrane protein assembly factor BamD [Microvirgula aerodenitrificans]
MKNIAVVMLIVAGLAGCASSSEPNDETRGWPVEKLYYEAHDELNSGNYTRSIKLYETLEARFPYGRYAQQAQMDLAYAHFKDQEPALALAACDRFIKLHPAHANVDYIYYLKGLINYNEDGGILAKYTGQDRAERDPKAARESYLAFNELVTRFPDSKYAPDAREKMTNLVYGLAEHDLFVSRYYMRRGAYIAAANRAQGMVKEFSDTPFVEEALAIMVTAYDKLGQPQLRDDSKRVLAKNYPNSQYLEKNWTPRQVPWYQFW